RDPGTGQGRHARDEYGHLPQRPRAGARRFRGFGRRKVGAHSLASCQTRPGYPAGSGLLTKSRGGVKRKRTGWLAVCVGPGWCVRRSCGKESRTEPRVARVRYSEPVPHEIATAMVTACFGSKLSGLLPCPGGGFI